MGVTLTDVLLFGKAQSDDVDNATLVIYRRNILRWSALGGYLDIIVKGVSPISLPDAIADSLEYLKAFGGTEQRNIPAEYTQVNYVTNTAQTLVDTGVKIDFSKNYEIELKVRGVVGSWYIFQAKETSGTEVWGISGSTSGQTIRLAFGTAASVTSQITRVDGHIYYIKATINNGNLTLYVKDETAGTEDTATGTYTVTTGQSANMCLLGNLTGQYVGINSDVYFARIKEDGVAVMDYVPCRQVATAGFYDKVSNSFKTTTNLVADGNTVPTPDTPMDIVSNNGVLKARHQSGLPLGYTLLDYIESDGTQYIDTGIVPTNADNTRVKFRFALNDTTNGENQSIGSNSNLNMYATSVTLKFRANGIEIKDFDTDWHAVEMSKSSAGKETIFDGVTYATSATTEESNNFYLFALKAVNNVYFGNYKLSYAEVYQSGTLVRNLIPCKNPSNVIGMYDTVTGQFFTNAGTGTFTAGSAVSDPVEVYADGTVETINVHGKNLFNKNAVTVGYMYNSDLEYVSNASASLSDYIPVVPGQQYTLSGTEASNFTIRVNYFNANKQIQSQYIGQSGSSNWSITVTIPSGIKYIRYSFRTTSVDNQQTELGSTATTYEPYFNGGTATAEMLLKVGDYEDVQEILSGAVTRKVGVKVFDGTEDWIYTNSRFRLEISDYLVGSSIMATILSHYKLPAIDSGSIADGEARFSKYQPTSTVSTSNILVIHDDNYTSLDSYKSWLASQYNAGTPVIVVYPLATPTTESVAGQPMQVQQGDNIVEITQASLDNLELEAKYQAAVSLTIQEVQDANLDPNVQVTIN